LITAPDKAVNTISEDERFENDSDSEASCAGIVNNMREEFLPADAATQTSVNKLVDAYASTYTP
jgi:hypothetical protein